MESSNQKLKASVHPLHQGPDFLSGGGEMGELIRAYDWVNSPLGPCASWSQSLKMMVSFMLANRFPLLLWWGPQYISIYNDAYRPVLGAKHPRALGQPVSECWAEIWHILQPLIDKPFQGEAATWMEDIVLEINRRGFTEETHFTIAYSPVPDDAAPRGIGGVLATVHEITDEVIGKRRLGTLRDLAAGALGTETVQQACDRLMQVLSRSAYDAPFAGLYVLDKERQGARLAASTGEVPQQLGPATLPPDLLEAGSARRLDVAEWGIVSGAWPAARVVEALLLPIHGQAGSASAWTLLVGLSPRSALDENYQSFLDLLGQQFSAAIANALAYEHERRRAEALAEIDRGKTVFFSNVSHEFRTPLTLMLGPVEEALANTATPAPVRDQLQLAHRNALRLQKLVNHLLDFSRIEAGRVRASYQATDLAALTRDLASTFRAAIERAGVRFVVDCALPEPVYVDREMWEKIVLNLLSNAFKFTFGGEIAVRLRVETRQALLEVADTGVGIAEEELPHLFERFHRIEGARGRTQEGSGIGLALVQELVRLHGGAIEVKSALDRGTTFSVRIPLGSAHLPGEQVRAAGAVVSTAIKAEAYVQEALRWIADDGGESSQRTRAPNYPGRTPAADRFLLSTAAARIVVADDNADMRLYLRELLSGTYSVETFADGEQAFAAAQRQRPDLVIADIMMPRLDGFGLLKRVRADVSLRDVPVILLSARAGEESRIEGVEAGADDYLVKPFSARELLARVGASVALARVRREYEAKLATDLAAMARLRALGERCVRSGDDLQGCLDAIVDTAMFITHAHKGNVRLLDAESGKLTIRAQRGFDSPFLQFFAEVSPGSTAMSGPSLRTAGRIVVPDVESSPLFAGTAELSVLREAGVRAMQSTPLLSSTGETLGLISVHFDHTHAPTEQEQRLMDLLSRQAADYLERRSAEQRQRRAEEQLRLATEAAEVGLWDVDLITDSLFWPPRVKAMFGISPDVPVSMADFYSGLHPADRQRVSEVFATALDPAKRAIYDAEYRTVGKEDGLIRWVAAKGRGIFDDSGKCVRVIGTAIDITARKHNEFARAAAEHALEASEEKYRNLFFNMVEEVHFWQLLRNDQGQIQTWKLLDINPAAVRAWRRNREEVLGKSADEIFPGATEHFMPVVQKIMKEGEAHAYETYFPPLNQHLRLTFVPLGEFFIITGADITASKNAALALQAADRQKDEFLAMLAHELRNPLAPIRNANELLSKLLPPTDARVTHAVAITRRQVNQLSRLVDDLLDVSRVTLGQITLQHQPIDLAHLVANAVETVQPLMHEKEHRLSLLTSGTQALYVNGDAARLQQCVVNLLANAAKYTDRGGEINVQVGAAGRSAIVKVSDTGIGISSELLPRVFDLFVQGDRALDRSQGGLGVGLAVVKRLIEMHQGEVRASSSGVGKGATFEIRLPLAERPADAQSAATTLKFPPTRLLIVDDNHDAADSLVSLLQLEGHDTEAAYSAQMALQRAPVFRPAVMLLDIGLPEMDGYDVARRLRGMPELQGMRLIAVTGYGQPEDRQRAHAAGFDLHLTKPVNLTSLGYAIAGWTLRH